MARRQARANMELDKQRSVTMSLQSSIIANLSSVQADMNYLAPMLERPRNYTYEPPPGVPRSNTQHEAHRVGETYSVKYNPAHRWFYVPRMQPDEALLLKCSDTSSDVPARFTPHSAFIDPSAPADAPPRESIEVRTLVFHR